jgi:hypothetical protein
MTSRREIVGPSGAELDQAITDIEGGEFRAYSTDEEAAAAIIAREGIFFVRIPENPFAPEDKWMASKMVVRGHAASARGPTKTVAAMRVHLKFYLMEKHQKPDNTPSFLERINKEMGL